MNPHLHKPTYPIFKTVCHFVSCCMPHTALRRSEKYPKPSSGCQGCSTAFRRHLLKSNSAYSIPISSIRYASLSIVHFPIPIQESIEKQQAQIVV
jgi:hypothetical protein